MNCILYRLLMSFA